MMILGKRFFTTSRLMMVIGALAGQPLLVVADDFSFTDGTDSGIFSLNSDTTGYARSGTLDITSGVDAGIYSLVDLGVYGGGTVPATPELAAWSATTVNNAFNVDNLIFTQQAGQTSLLDYWGLLFTGTSNSGNSLEVNIWANQSSTSSAPTTYSIEDFNILAQQYGFSNNNVSISDVTTTPSGVSSVPLPATFTMMALGFAFIGSSLRYRRDRKSVV